MDEGLYYQVVNMDIKLMKIHNNKRDMSEFKTWMMKRCKSILDRDNRYYECFYHYFFSLFQVLKKEGMK